MVQLRGALSQLLCRHRSGSRGAALLRYASFQHRHTHGIRGTLLPPSMPLPRFLGFVTFAATAADPSASAPPETAATPSVVDYLIHSFGFSPDEAASVCNRTRLWKASRNLESVLSFFTGKGLDKVVVRKLVTRRPTLLFVDVEKVLAPKFRAFEEMGFTGSDMRKIFRRTDSLLGYSLEKKLIPNISLIREECGISGQMLLKLLRASPRVLGRSRSSLKEVIERVRKLGFRHGSHPFCTALHMANCMGRRAVDARVAYFRRLGWTEKETLSAIRRNPVILGLSERKVDGKVAFFRSLGWIERDTLSTIRRNPLILGLTERLLDEKLAFFKSFGWTEKETFSAIQRTPLILSLSGRLLDEKVAFFKSLGWTEEETFSAVRIRPVILGLSRKRVKDSIDFFVREAGCSMPFLAAKPVLLTYSIEKRVKTRYNVYRILQSEHLPEGDWSLLYLFGVSEKKFLDKVIHKYADRLPELSAVYGAGP